MGVLLASRAALRDVRHGLVMPRYESGERPLALEAEVISVDRRYDGA
jgi:hypothetical protein